MNFGGPDRIRTGTTHRDRVALSTIQPQDQIFANQLGFEPKTPDLKGHEVTHIYNTIKVTSDRV